MELRQFETFVTIVRVGGFRRAAEEMLLTQPALSQQMRLLEAELGVTLFERGSRPIALTQAGEALYARAQQLLDGVGVVREEMRDYTRLQRGYVRIGTASSYSAPWVPALLQAFRRAHPTVDVEVNEFASDELLGLLLERQIDLACLTMPGPGSDPPEGLHWACVGTTPLVFAVPSGHRLDQRTDVRLEELASESLIAPAHSVINAVFERAFGARGLRPRSCMHVTDQHLLLELVAVGIGVGVSNHAQVAAYPELNLWPVELADVSLNVTGAAVWADRARHNCAVDALIDVVAAWARACPEPAGGRALPVDFTARTPGHRLA